MTILYLMRNRIIIFDEEYQEFKLKIFHRIQIHYLELLSLPNKHTLI